MSASEVTTYRQDNIYWAEANGILDLPAAYAWMGLDRLLMRIIDIPSTQKKTIKLLRAKKNAPITDIGNELIARAEMLHGVIKATMSMKVTESIPESYLRLDVRTYNMSFAVIDFGIERVESGCRLTFRQGFRSRKGASRSGEAAAATPREMPETARIFDMWVSLAQAVEREQGSPEARLANAKGT